MDAQSHQKFPRQENRQPEGLQTGTSARVRELIFSACHKGRFARAGWRPSEFGTMLVMRAGRRPGCRNEAVSRVASVCSASRPNTLRYDRSGCPLDLLGVLKRSPIFYLSLVIDSGGGVCVRVWRWGGGHSSVFHLGLRAIPSARSIFSCFWFWMASLREW